MLVSEKLTVAPVIEPVTLTEAKEHAIIETDYYDDVVSRKIKAAREWVEGYLNRALVEQTWRYRLDEFPHGHRHSPDTLADYLEARQIWLPRSPLISITSIEYVDTAGASQTLSASAYVVDTDGEPPRIAEAYGFEWPTTYPELNSVTVTAVHGNVTGSPLDITDCPESIREAIMILAAEMYQHRVMTVTGLDVATIHNVQALLARYYVRPIIL